MRTSNPTLSEETFNRYAYLTGVEPSALMTVRGTIHKTFLLVAMAIATGTVAWVNVRVNPGVALPLILGSAIIGFIVAIVATIKHEKAPVLAPAYALIEGVFLGAASAVIESLYPGVVMQAVPLTFGVMLAMLGLYRAGVLKASPTFVKVVVTATAAVCVVYLISFGMRLFGYQMPYLHDATPIGIGISVVTTAIAALNFILDFDLVEKGAEQGAPKHMEWYGAFGIVVTLFWLYWEIVRLLVKIRSFLDD